MPEETLTSKLQPLDDGAVFADDRETIVKVDHITMEFNMASEQLNSLKEYVIALAKHKLYFEKFTALDDISFEVKKGDVFGILGTNGSGKSTLLKIIAGVLEPTKGSCEINGNIAPLIELGAGFDMELSARENIYLNGSLLGYSKQFIDEHFDDIVSFAEIEKFLDMPMKNYSSGMVARIAFAIATVIVPEILIVDEVLSVGDFMFQQKCEDRINDLIENHGVTVLIVSHSNDQIERLCNKAIWIEKGHTRIMGDATQVCNAYRVLGGRTGSKESEDIVYNALAHSSMGDVGELQPTIYTGKDHFELSSNAVLTNWTADECNCIFLVPDHTHVFDLAISGLAGALGAPILPVSNFEIPTIIRNSIQALKPSVIYIAADAEVAARLAQDPKLQELATDIITIPCNEGCRGIRLATLQFGIDNCLWESSTAILAYHDDLISSFAISPFTYIKRAPFIITDPKRIVIEEDVLKQIEQIGIDRFITIGSISQSPIVEDLISKQYEIVKLTESESYSSLSSILNWLNYTKTCKPDSCIVASSDKSKMQSVLFTPAVAGKSKTGILFEDISDLDSVASCIKALRKIPRRTIVGYKEMLGENAKLLGCIQ